MLAANEYIFLQLVCFECWMKWQHCKKCKQCQLHYDQSESKEQPKHTLPTHFAQVIMYLLQSTMCGYIFLPSSRMSASFILNGKTVKLNKRFIKQWIKKYVGRMLYDAQKHNSIYISFQWSKKLLLFAHEFCLYLFFLLSRLSFIFVILFWPWHAVVFFCTLFEFCYCKFWINFATQNLYFTTGFPILNWIYKFCWTC